MAYRIKDIRDVQPVSGRKYLFDANIWLGILDLNLQGYYAGPYEDFFDDIYGSTDENPPVIVMPALLVSEVLNRLVNDIYYKEFCIDNPRPDGMTKPKHFKDVYRSSERYKKDIRLATGSIHAYMDRVVLLSDNASDITPEDMLLQIPDHLDFNDHFYCELALKQDLTIVTGDSDFKVEDIEILTTHPFLLRLANRRPYRSR